ncbi:hypothetical protein [Candidatus Tisiphia endosymbiont of Ditula angustiorana]|uniref:hypothetical protein n=1 Tax=Candidatus Tisiphia endosymbiont of Ditula angustiorana TaxID=3066272 RepID=UPI00312CA65D
MISSNNDIGNTVNNVINREPLPHINNINPKLLKAAAVLLSQAHNANVSNTLIEVGTSSSQDNNVTIPNTTLLIPTSITYIDNHPSLLGEYLEPPTE